MTDFSKSYRNSCGDNAFECYYCGKFFARADKQKRNIESCSGVPGTIHNFNKKNLITFEENFKSKGDLPFALDFDFKITAPTIILIQNKQKYLLFLTR